MSQLERITFRDDPQQAFNEAIAAGRLSDKAEAANYANRYMYMGDKLNKHGQRVPMFKHMDTREYLPD